jgi:hypothetical protein
LKNVAETFEQALRSLIGERHDSASNFAETLGLSSGRVSQLLAGTETALSYRSLQLLLTAFPSAIDQERLYAAWQRSYALSPRQSLVLTEQAEDQVRSYITGALDLAPGNPDAVLAQVSALWRQLINDERDFELLMATGRAYAEVCFLVSRRFIGLRIAGQMLQLAVRRQEPRWVTTALWLQAVGARPLLPTHPTLATKAFASLSQYLVAWHPLSSPDRVIRQDIERALARDQVLLSWEQQRNFGGYEDAIRADLGTLQRGIVETDDQSGLALAKGVEARAYTALGEFDLAYQSLSEARAADGSPLMRLKTDISEIRLLIAEGDRRQAAEQLGPTMAFATEQRLLHYQLELVQLDHTIHGIPSRKRTNR